MKIFYLCVFFTSGALAAPTVDMKNFFKEKTKIENPFELRDPFKAPVIKDESQKKNNQGFFLSGKGQYSNIVETPLQNMSVQDIKVVGVLIGKERRAIISVKDSKSIIIVKEGTKIGHDDAELKAILPGGLILVEKIVNVYGQEEYLETVIPISK